MAEQFHSTSVISVLPVDDYAAALDWYSKWIGRGPDVEPMAGIAEWQITDTAWIQVSTDTEVPGNTTVVLGVEDIDVQLAIFSATGIAWGEVNDYGFVKTADSKDPAGNTITLVQEVAQTEEA